MLMEADQGADAPVDPPEHKQIADALGEALGGASHDDGCR